MDAIERAFNPKEYSEYVEYYAGKYDLDPLLVYSFICTESDFEPTAQSSVDARGLMQITEETFDWLKSRIAKITLERYDGDVSTAAAAYHSGWGTVDQLLESPEYSENGTTLNRFPYEQMALYVKKINQNYETYRRLYS